MDNQTQEILKGLEPLFQKAEKEGLWFYCSYQQLWFSHEELKKNQNEGRFIWGAVNWQLRDPQEKLRQLENEKIGIDQEIEKFKSRI